MKLKKLITKAFGVSYFKPTHNDKKYESYLLLLGRIENDSIETINHIKGYKRLIELYNRMYCIEYYKQGIESKSVNTLNKALNKRINN